MEHNTKSHVRPTEPGGRCHRKTNVFGRDGGEVRVLQKAPFFFSPPGLVRKRRANFSTPASLLLCCTGRSPNHTDQKPAKLTHTAPFNLDFCTSCSTQTRQSSKFSTRSLCVFHRGRCDMLAEEDDGLDVEICHQQRSTPEP